ncbi:hypothetical protein ASE00_16595 [Sphingomonas sp. Root710]|nr:hypothetical protein ASE00_16595 [Sphingomonas sp. Root710]
MTTPAFDKVRLDGRAIMITGGAAGIGKATALLCAARGASVLVADLDEGSGADVVAEIERQGGKAVFKHTDVADEEDVRAAVAAATASFGRLDGAFNNAGIMISGTPIHELSLEQWHKGLAINLTGVFLCVKHQLAHMRANGGGAIVNNASASGVVGIPLAINYVATKHGVIGITRAAAAEVSGQGVRVNAIMPGAVETPLLQEALRSPEVRQAVAAGHPIGRISQPGETAETVAWLLSDAASFVAGAAIAIDGGYTAL